MKVVNIKVKNIRPEYENLEEWCKDKNNIYIGRKAIVFISKENIKYRYPKNDSILHNPCKIGKYYNGIKVETRDIACDMFYKYMNEKLDNETETGIYHTAIKNLKDKNIGCFCFPERCHGDELVKIYKERF